MSEYHNGNGLFYTSDLSGKMLNVMSIPTDTMGNDFCSDQLRRSISLNKYGVKLVCQTCYARRYESLRPSIRVAYRHNSNLLSSALLSDDDIPYLNAEICRFDSDGELINDIHYLNIKRIAEKNRDVQFALWTKRPEIVQRNGFVKNIIYIYSSAMLNKVAEKPYGFNKVFTVFEKDRDADINCRSFSGACMSCRLCYSTNKTVYINEIKK